MITREMQERLAAGAQALRDNPDAISHARLVGMVADWIDAEALMYEMTELFVEVLAGIEVKGQRACAVSLVSLPGGRVATHCDTSSHAERIVAALAWSRSWCLCGHHERWHAEGPCTFHSDTEKCRCPSMESHPENGDTE